MENVNIQLGIAPIGWSNDELLSLGGEISFEQCISEMALSGFTGCEIGVKFPKDIAVLKKQLSLRNLQVCNHWFCFELTTKSLKENRQNFEAHLDFLGALNANIVGGGETGNSCQSAEGVPVLEGKGMLNSAQEWQDYNYKMNELGKIALDRGFRMCYHHHMGAIIQTMEETDKLLDGTDPKYVSLNYDCAHFAFSGDDPVVAFQKYLPRIGHIHIKDIRPERLQRVKDERMSYLQAVAAGVFTVPGDPSGSLDLDAIFKMLKESDYKGWLVIEADQDPDEANPFEYALIARKYIKDKLGI